ncbi:hypothetical protein [Nostoc sphaeroides]|nr:hypothetical protein [Nostoc sphaeroides]
MKPFYKTLITLGAIAGEHPNFAKIPNDYKSQLEELIKYSGGRNNDSRQKSSRPSNALRH